MAHKARKFSVHPKLAAIIDLILNAATLFWFPLLTDWHWFGAWFLTRAILWALFIRLVYYPPELSRWRHFLSLVFFNFGLIVSLSIFIEWNIARYLLNTVFIVFSASSFWLLPVGADPLLFYQKPYRRWLFLMDAFGLAGFWCGIFALMSFQLIRATFFPLLYFIGSFASAGIAFWWWREYGIEYSKRLFFSVLACFVLSFELSWIVSRWPLGFLVNGMIMIWFWYSWWLIMRFNLSKEGINWKKQKFFIFSAVILFFIFMVFARWH